MTPDTDQHFRQVDQPAVFGQAQEEIEIFTDLQVFAVAANSIQRGFAHHEGGLDEGGAKALQQ